ncbi:MAG: TOBE domain-containing protein, partial [Firmicutes bacterium]|nr:TOBE domain-containing protein [Bacillota bacterium]
VMERDLQVRFAGRSFECVDRGFMTDEPVDVVVRPEDVDVVAPENGMLTGTVTEVTFMGVHYEVIVEIRGFKWMIQTTDYVSPGQFIGIFIEPDAIHVMKKSKYSDMFGDYSSYSNELDQLSENTEEEGRE